MIIEHHTFRLVAGIADEDFLAADKRVQEEFSMHQFGFVRRTTARAGAEWLIESMWWFGDNAEDALRSDHDTVVTLRELIDADTESVRRYETLD